MSDYVGIDYGLGKSNIDSKTGIRYGVIGQRSVMPEAMDDVEYDYGEPTCPECGNLAVSSDSDVLPEESEDWENGSKYGCNDWACTNCECFWDSDRVYSEEPLGWIYQMDGYELTDCLDADIFVVKSPYYTFAQFCSPCVPGAGNLDNPMEDGVKTYCLGPDWFEDNEAPYPVYSVADNTLIIPQTGNQEEK